MSVMKRLASLRRSKVSRPGCPRAITVWKLLGERHVIRGAERPASRDRAKGKRATPPGRLRHLDRVALHRERHGSPCARPVRLREGAAEGLVGASRPPGMEDRAAAREFFEAEIRARIESHDLHPLLAAGR